MLWGPWCLVFGGFLWCNYSKPVIFSGCSEVKMKFKTPCICQIQHSEINSWSLLKAFPSMVACSVIAPAPVAILSLPGEIFLQVNQAMRYPWHFWNPLHFFIWMFQFGYPIFIRNAWSIFRFYEIYRWKSRFMYQIVPYRLSNDWIKSQKCLLIFAYWRRSFKFKF